MAPETDEALPTHRLSCLVKLRLTSYLHSFYQNATSLTIRLFRINHQLLLQLKKTLFCFPQAVCELQKTDQAAQFCRSGSVAIYKWKARRISISENAVQLSVNFFKNNGNNSARDQGIVLVTALKLPSGYLTVDIVLVANRRPRKASRWSSPNQGNGAI